MEIVGDVARGFRSYVAIRSLLGVMTAALYGLWLWLWDVDLIIVWMLLAFLLNFVPTLGSLIAGGLASAFAFLQHDIGSAVAVGLGLLAIEQVMGNYVDPRLQGRRLSISPFVVLFMLLLWTWIWGVAGALLAVPITVLMVMVISRVPALAPIAFLFSHGESETASSPAPDRG
jgi:AI-2 transport protein TqsA